MKNRASALLKQIIATLKSMAKSKALALKTKTNAIKTRLVIFSLLRNKKFLMSSISHKLRSVLGHHSYPKDDSFLEDGCDQSRVTVSHDENAHSCEALPRRMKMETVSSEDKGEDGYESCYRYEEEEEDEKYPDLTHTLFDTEDFEGSVIDMVKSSKEAAGEEFKLEDDIDHVADWFIKRVHDDLMLQKQQSIKRHREEMLKNNDE
ncbi:uncharacterized protein LOC129285495 [Prosopis cineraria]|uniref:uncharacterized protein LOC129285495 n=1 Tax=Prosopis cineraria TaxID=364024 RepID=UPI0024105FE2|nr:uncharacterized protein LOC129285495 [Prosopis cineraria]